MRIAYSRPPDPPRVFDSPAAEVTVGRSWSGSPVDLDLSPDVLVSHLHARITQDGDTYWVEDLGSRNGTWVNGQRIRTKTRFTSQDSLQLGRTTLALEGVTAVGSMAAAERAEADDGVVTRRLQAAELPSPSTLPEDPGREALKSELEAARRRLGALYELGMGIGTGDGLGGMLQAIVRHLIEAIPGAQRSALLLRDGENLLLKAHFPEGDLSASLSVALQAMERREGLIWQPGTEVSGNDAPASFLHFGTRCAMYAPMVQGEEVLGVVCVDNRTDAQAFDEDDLRLLMAIANHAGLFVKNHLLQQELQREAAVRSNLLRQFSPRIAERLLKERGRLRLGGERARLATILVTDVRGFTALSTRLDPDELVHMLNEMFGVLTPILFKHDGTVDKYVGDAVLAVFGTPEPDDAQCEKAVRAAVEIQEAMQKLADAWQMGGLPAWELGVGIHCGEVVHGFIGSRDRMEYTVIGDAVNRAARYCEGAGPGEILISGAVYEHVYRLVSVAPKVVQTKHPESEGNLEGYLVRGLRMAAGLQDVGSSGDAANAAKP